MPKWIVPSLWLVWLAYWIVAARGVKAVATHESAGSRASYLVPLMLAAVLLAARDLPPAWLHERFVPPTPLVEWAGAALLAAGLGFAAWARHHLAGNWSGTVTLKQDHELIRSGPYAVVRHPIYTGLLAAILGTALTVGEWRGLIALALFVVSIVRKMTIEEEWMARLFGADYARYRADVPALIPVPFHGRHGG